LELSTLNGPVFLNIKFKNKSEENDCNVAVIVAAVAAAAVVVVVVVVVLLVVVVVVGPFTPQRGIGPL
jgi:uncharacterized membrane-anchored protein